MTDVEAMMRQWLASGTPAQVAHARARLALPFASDPPPRHTIHPSGTTVTGGDRELVVSHHRESLDWLTGVGFPVTVYSKGGETPPGLRVVRRPNVGREAETILTHICSRYHSLPETTFFVQGDPFDHAGSDFLARLSGSFPEPTTLTTRYLPGCPDDAVTAADLVVTVNGFECRYGAGDHLGQFGGARGRTADWCRTVWGAVFTTPMPSPLYFGYGACWAVPRAAILARPIEHWRWLLSAGNWTATTDRDPVSPLTPWGFELLWRYLFADPVLFPLRVPVAVAVPRRGCGCGGTKPSAKVAKPKAGKSPRDGDSSGSR